MAPPKLVMLPILPHDHLQLSSRDTERFAPIQDAASRDQIEEVEALIGTLAPQKSVIQHQFALAIGRLAIPMARCFLEAGAEVDGGAVNRVCWASRSKASTDVNKALELLTEYGWDVNAVWGSLPTLCWVIKNEGVVQYLLEQGANANIGCKELWNSDSAFTTKSGLVLNYAAHWGSLKTFNLLVQYGARVEYSVALHYAAAAEFTEIRRTLMETLLDLGCDINQLDDAMGPQREGTPLHRAADRGRLEGVRWLLEHGADPKVKNRRGILPINFAIKECHTEVVELLEGWPAPGLHQGVRRLRLEEKPVEAVNE